MDESYSYGAHQTRDASTISPTTKEEALVIADDITSLPNLSAYIRFPEKFPSTLVSFPYVGFPSVAEGFIEATPPPDFDPADEEDGDGEEGGGQDIAADRPEPGVEPKQEDRREISDVQDGREVRARDVLDVGRPQLDGRTAAPEETGKGNSNASLAKRSIDDDPPPGAVRRNRPEEVRAGKAR